MCGIAAVIGDVREGEWHQTHELLTELLVQSLPRGRDATGFAAVTSPLDHPARHRLITSKEPLPADKFVIQNPFWRQLRRLRCAAVLGHVRAATSGSPSDNRNNHPHFFDGKRYALTHNGWFLNVRDAADRHALRLRTDCDSEVAARLIEATGSITKGLGRCLTDLNGAQALVVLDTRTGTLWLARDDNRPLWVARLKDDRRTIVASTAEIVCRAVERTLGPASERLASIHPLAAYYVHGLTTDGRLIAPFTSPARPPIAGGQ
jgi:glucosamine 6-phosphate synthetase-like amidotransferase/phosphosugar isomerase protein